MVQDRVTADTDKLCRGRGTTSSTERTSNNRDTVTCGPGNDFFDADPGDGVDLSSWERPF
jgi:hypothetical protein